MIKEPKNWINYEKLKKEFEELSPEDDRYEELCEYFGFYSNEGASQLEDIAQNRIIKPQISKIKLPFRQKDFNLLDYENLRSIFYGMHNIEIPKEMADILNPDEHLAKLLGTGGLKHKFSEHGKYTDDFFDLIRILDRSAYGYIDFQRMRKEYIKDMEEKGIKLQPNTRDKQVERLEQLDESVRDRFLNSFSQEYIPSIHESNLSGFADPDYDGRNKGNYVRALHRYLK